MKAEEYFEERFIKTNKEPNHYDLDRQRFDAYDMIDFAQQFAEKYARIQIEKHNERIKAKYPPCPEYSKTVDSLSTSFRNAVDETPIILD